jgi:hypothetical protein
MAEALSKNRQSSGAKAKALLTRARTILPVLTLTRLCQNTRRELPYDDRVLDIKETFASHRYAVIRGILTEPRRRDLYRYARIRAESGTMHMRDSQVRETPVAYADEVMERLLQDTLPMLENVTGLQLFPTYSYLRIYKRGDVLRQHTDRPACEISLSICLGQEEGEPWPISITGPHGTTSVGLQPGDALLYRGIECPHWRDALVGDKVAQVFLHYVAQDGPHREWKYDRRTALSTTAAGVTNR